MNKGFVDDEDIYEIVIAIIFASFIFGCCCTLCCCGAIIGAYNMYKQSGKTFHTLRGYQFNNQTPNLAYAQRENV